MLSRLFLVILAITGTGCSFTNSNKSMAKNELVMCQGMIIEATNQNGTIRIEAGRGLRRTYTWDHQEIQLNLRKRTKRWYGSLGAYSPHGTTKIHAVVEEGQQHFCSKKEALEWLNWEDDRFKYQYSPDGLVVGWYFTDKDPNDSFKAICVQVWQIYINGRKPDMNNSQKNNVSVSFDTSKATNLPKAGVFTPSIPKIINGRMYSGKAIDFITKDSGVKGSFEDVEEVIEHGTLHKKGPYRMFISPDKQISKKIVVVFLDDTGRVVLAY